VIYIFVIVLFLQQTNHILASNSILRGRDLHFWKELAETIYEHIVSGRTACLDRGPRLGRLAPASEVAGGHTLPFYNWQTMPLLITVQAHISFEANK
jgi:hypothetical protein